MNDQGAVMRLPWLWIAVGAAAWAAVIAVTAVVTLAVAS